MLQELIYLQKAIMKNNYTAYHLTTGLLKQILFLLNFVSSHFSLRYDEHLWVPLEHVFNLFISWEKDTKEVLENGLD